MDNTVNIKKESLWKTLFSMFSNVEDVDIENSAEYKAIIKEEKESGSTENIKNLEKIVTTTSSAGSKKKIENNVKKNEILDKQSTKIIKQREDDEKTRD